MNPKSTKKTKIVIAGGGFAGLYAAKYLDKTVARRVDIEVTLVTRENFILFTPTLHEVAAGDLSSSDIVNPLRRILRHVNVVEAEVDAIDLTAKKNAESELRKAAAKRIERGATSDVGKDTDADLSTVLHAWNETVQPLATGKRPKGTRVPDHCGSSTFWMTT
jgi:NADPH-dependent 2,4-dienoyl-CoA reductase/sulfur reductase-like enzyme